MVLIDGSYGEGGGQIIRTSLSLSAVTGQPLEITHIRAGREKPGLQPQHLTAVRAAASLCRATLEGDTIGSTRLRFIPTCPVVPSTYHFEIGTAGAAPLVVQTLLLPLLVVSSESRLTVTGGTHVPHAPTSDYLEGTYLSALSVAGLRVELRSPRAGFYPKGGGLIEAVVHPCPDIRPVELVNRGRLITLKAAVVTSLLPEHVARRGSDAIVKYMKGIGRPIDVQVQEKPSSGPGAAVTITAACEQGYAGFVALGERGKPMERVAEEACAAFRRWWESGAACDEHLADQLALPMALSTGESAWTTPSITTHLRTVLHVIQQFLPASCTLEERADGSGLVRLRGAGLPQ